MYYILKRLSDTEIARKLEMRETLMRRQAIFHVVLGARKLNGMPESLGKDICSGHYSPFPGEKAFAGVYIFPNILKIFHALIYRLWKTYPTFCGLFIA